MVTSIKDNEGKVIAYAEYRIVDKNGIDTKEGEYCWINDCYIAPQFRYCGLLKEMLRIEFKKHNWVRWIYFIRSIHNERTRIYDIKKFLKKGESSGRWRLQSSNTTCSTDSDVESARVYKSVATVTCD